MRWPCTYHNVSGKQCSLPAAARYFFNEHHPFDHVDRCTEHAPKWFARMEFLSQEPPIYAARVEVEGAGR
jgi:hypothetical protein